MNHKSLEPYDDYHDDDIAFKKKSRQRLKVDLETLDSSESEDDLEVQDSHLYFGSRKEDNHKEDLFVSKDDKISKDNKVNAEIEDEDMFASDEDEVVKKKVQFIDRDQPQDINSRDDYSNYNHERYREDTHQKEEQDFDESEEEDDITSSHNTISEEDGSEVDEAKEPRIERFDLSEEKELGIIDNEGNLIKHGSEDEKDAEEEYISGFSKHEILKAKRAEEERTRIAKEQQMNINANKESIRDILKSLIEILEPAETPMESLARLNSILKKKKKQKLNGIQASSEITCITDCCSKLTKSSLFEEPYDVTREEFMREYQKVTGLQYINSSKRHRDGDEEADDRANQTINDDEQDQTENDYGEKIWEFKWIGETNLNGPYSEYEMYHWKENYFQSKVLVRKLGEASFKHIEEVTFIP
ncbi:uncharacterized protein KGF55_003661 [Candida pseudojiufengensis]|uniref:uncharacterized protein n=1 Tax=Candida pseudojiufengensis TaxID=497109 RepID=UPI0022250A40|nr:uncharacterized protein KGF55_003661 [Candida pseudojiufengensis]KAI5962585.1 hypothetical protein KGF55_003661 [Candida pseudojiufengensis]